MDAAREADSRDGPQNFEVGVFCGTYITPVDDEYFQHLERIRGQTRKMKVVDEARRAVAQGVAGQDQIDLATNGAVVTQTGKVVPATNGDSRKPSVDTNGAGWQDHQNSAHDQSPNVRERMDISIHNLGDFPRND
jgi:amidophosphoribosyltransferase